MSFDCHLLSDLADRETVALEFGCICSHTLGPLFRLVLILSFFLFLLFLHFFI